MKVKLLAVFLALAFGAASLSITPVSEHLDYEDEIGSDEYNHEIGAAMGAGIAAAMRGRGRRHEEMNENHEVRRARHHEEMNENHEAYHLQTHENSEEM